MADNFFKTDPTTQEEAPPEKVKVGDAEYTSDELSELIEKGKFAKDIETKQNTKLDRVYPEYTKTQQELKRVNEELEKLKAAAAPTDPELTPELKAKAQRQLQEILGGEVITRSELGKWYAAQKAGDRLLDECSELEGEIDGSDGRPKFEKEKILDHMKDTGIANPLRAYKDMYETELDAWKEKQLSGKRRGMDTLETLAAGKKPTEPKITKDNLSSAVREVLWGNREE